MAYFAPWAVEARGLYDHAVIYALGQQEKEVPKSTSAKPSDVKPRKIDWVYSTLPINIALGPIGTFVQLYLIHLNGVQAGTVYAAAAVTASNAVSIPAAIIWGFATDRLGKL